MELKELCFLFALVLLHANGYELRASWIPVNATGCFDDPYYYDNLFVSLGAGTTCRIDITDTTGNGQGTTSSSRGFDTLEDCLQRCFSLGYCTGVEYNSDNTRCEIWNRTVGYVKLGSGPSECVARQDLSCLGWSGKDCKTGVKDFNASERINRLVASCGASQ
eukprot:s7956_g1.t1